MKEMSVTAKEDVGRGFAARPGDVKLRRKDYKPFVGGPVGKLAAVLRRAVIRDDRDTGTFCPLASSSVPRNAKVDKAITLWMLRCKHTSEKCSNLNLLGVPECECDIIITALSTLLLV